MRVDVDVYVSGVRWNEPRKGEEKGRDKPKREGQRVCHCHGGGPLVVCRPRDGDMGSAYPPGSESNLSPEINHRKRCGPQNLP